MSTGGGQPDFTTAEEVRQQRNLIERVSDALGTDDDFLAALVANQVQMGRLERQQNEILTAIREEGVVDVGEIDLGEVAVEDAFQNAIEGAYQELIVEREPVTLAYPDIPQLAAGSQWTDDENRQRAGVATGGITEFDFEAGEVRGPRVGTGAIPDPPRTEDMSNALRETDENVIRSLFMFADGPFFWKTDTGEGGFQYSDLSVNLTDIAITNLRVKTQVPTVMTVVGSTSPEPTFTTSGLERFFEPRVTWEGNERQTVGTSYENVQLTPISETYKDNPQVGTDFFVGNMKSIAVVIDSDVNDRPLDIMARAVVVPEFGTGETGVSFIPNVDVPGWKENSPKTMEPNETDIFEMDVTNFDNLRFRARNGGADGNAFLQMAVFGLTE